VKYRQVLAVLGIAMSTSSIAADEGVRFDVVLLRDGAVIASPSVLAEFGKSVTVELAQLMRVEAVASAPEGDGRSATSVKLFLFDHGRMMPVQEMSMRAQLKATPSFEYTVPDTKVKFIVMPRSVSLPQAKG
jgi:hypothetical protein